jgi:acetylornithine deacetylase/succinyl-diaminopimelate desuccinylase-like protein
MLPKAVGDYLDSHRQQHVEKLMELLRIPSVANVSDSPHPCQLAAEWLARHLDSLGLRAEVAPTDGQPVVLAEARVADDRPTVLVYGHYDVQPAEPLEKWHGDPFEPVVRDGSIVARGASDNKGQHFTYLMAIEAWQRAGGGLPVNVKLFLEGEEEIGSPHLEPFVAASAERLAADFCVISDSSFFAEGVPSLTYALRGLAYFQIMLRGAAADAHSGVHGGALGNPIDALTRMVAAMHDDAGRVTLPGFYDDVADLADWERQAWRELPFDEADYAASLGVEALSGGEKGYSALERRWARPTLDCNGIFGGYTQPGSKTIIPAEAAVKLSMRLVPDQDPQKVAAALRQFVAAHTPAGMTSSVAVHATARPVRLATDGPAIDAARAALLEAFDTPATLIRCGASVPVTEMIQRLLGLDAVLMGFGLPDDGPHAPNERFRLDQLRRGARAAAAFLGNLAARSP